MAQPALALSPTAHLRTYWQCWLTTFCFFAGFYALITPLPQYFLQIGLAEWQIGMILGTFGIASLLGRPFAGWAVDRFGVRRLMIAGAAALFLGAAGVAFTQNIWLLVGLRLLQALGYVGFTTAGTAAIVLISAPQERGQRLALYGAAANVAIMLAPLAVSVLLSWFPLASGFALAGGFALLAGLLALPIAVPQAAQAQSTQITWGFPRVVWMPMLITGLLGAGFAAFFQFAPLLADQQPQLDPGLLYLVYGCSIIGIRVVGSRLIDRLGTQHTLLISSALMALGLGMLATLSASALVWAGVALVAIGSGLFHPALIAYHNVLLPGKPGQASAAFYIGFDVGIGVGSWILGVALEFWGIAGLYGLAASFALIALLLSRAVIAR